METKESHIALVLLKILYLRTWRGSWLAQTRMLSTRFMVLVAAPIKVMSFTISGEINFV